MGVLKFNDLPNTETPVNSNNLNNNFSYTVPTGGIVEFAGSTAPNGWLMCDGSEVSRTTYAELFGIIGTTFGEGDGNTTFNLPDKRGRVGIGAGQSSADTNGESRLLNLGQKGGAFNHTLTELEMPSHTHTIGGWLTNAPLGGIDKPLNYGMPAETNVFYSTTQPSGGGQPHNIVQPYLGINYIIKY